jgi:starch synthase
MNPAFSIYFAGDAYSTATKIMGRQSAGQSFMSGMARTWPHAQFSGLGHDQRSALSMSSQLRAEGFSGKVRWSQLPDWTCVRETGCLYYPAPPAYGLAAARGLSNCHAFSIMGVTHTLSSAGAMDQIAALVLPPFATWDALICTSTAAHRLVASLHEDMRRHWRERVGATRFAQPQLPVIPLGVNAPMFSGGSELRLPARQKLGLATEEVVFLFAGRLSFHAKANPAAVYMALEAAAAHCKVVCVEAGIFPNDGIRQGILNAQKALAPSVRFIWVDGKDQAGYRRAWQAADVFVSLSDNIQETFGLTPLEAMAAGLPVIVSDWDGYRDTVRHGIDGFRIPTVIPPTGCGTDLALRHALGLDTYDYYIGRVSLATVVEPRAVKQAVMQLATNSELRRQMGEAGRARAQSDYDWPVILRRYDELAHELSAIRQKAAASNPAPCPIPWPQRSDPFDRFSHFATATLNPTWVVKVKPDTGSRLEALLELSVGNFGLDPTFLGANLLRRTIAAMAELELMTVEKLIEKLEADRAETTRAVMWLWKFDLVEVGAPA